MVTRADLWRKLQAGTVGGSSDLGSDIGDSDSSGIGDASDIGGGLDDGIGGLLHSAAELLDVHVESTYHTHSG